MLAYYSTCGRAVMEILEGRTTVMNCSSAKEDFTYLISNMLVALTSQSHVVVLRPHLIYSFISYIKIC